MDQRDGTGLTGSRKGKPHGVTPARLLFSIGRFSYQQRERTILREAKMFRLACLVLILLSLPARAQVQAPAPSYGFGSGKCSAYLSDVRQRGDVAKALYFSWAQGFITATNGLMQKASVPAVTDFTAKMANPAQQALLDELCKAEPDKDFSGAVLQLLDKIRVAQGLDPILQRPTETKPQ